MNVVMEQTVIPRKLGPPVVGKVFGFCQAQSYATKIRPDLNFLGWDREYPLWRNGLVIWVEFEQPICLTQGYCQSGCIYCLAYPEEDLVIFNDDFVEDMGKSMVTKEGK